MIRWFMYICLASIWFGVGAACSDDADEGDPSATTAATASTEDASIDAEEGDVSGLDTEADSVDEDTPEPGSDEEIVADWLTGDFNSRAQSQRDRRYFDVHLYAIQVFPEESEGFWMYVQQSRDDDEDGTYEPPYRQRVYHVQANVTGDRIISTVYRIEAEERFVDPWVNPGTLDALSMSDLEEAQGCAVTLTREGAESFVGGTRPTSCRLSFGGYVTSSVNLREFSFTSLDLIYDEDGRIVNGLTPESAPYSFVKTENFPVQPGGAQD